MLNIISTWEMQIKTISLYIYQEGKLKNIDKTKSWQGYGATLNTELL